MRLHDSLMEWVFGCAANLILVIVLVVLVVVILGLPLLLLPIFGFDNTNPSCILWFILGGEPVYML